MKKPTLKMIKKKIIKITSLIFLNLALILIFLILLDPVIGMITNEKQGISREINFKENRPFSEFKINPNQREKNTSPVLKRTDKYGFILGPEEKSTEEIDFVFLGASNVESENVQENKRFPYLSIKMLNEKLGTSFNSRNAGVGGNLLSTSNLILTTKIININPEYIVLSSSLIDLLYLSKNESYWTGSKKYLININPCTSLLKSIKNYFFPNIWLQLRKFMVQTDNSGFNKTEFSPLDKERILKEYGRQLDIFITTCNIYNINPILMTDYYVAEIVGKSLQERGVFTKNEVDYYLNTLIPELNELIVNKATAFGVPVIKLHELVEDNKAFINNEDGVHLTNIGSEKLSEVISNYLLRKIEHGEI